MYVHLVGHGVAQLCKELPYKPEGHGFYDPGVNSASNRNDYQEYLLGVEAAGT